VIFADPTQTEVNINIASITFNGTTLTLGDPYGLSFLGGALYYTDKFIITQTARDLAGGELLEGGSQGGRGRDLRGCEGWHALQRVVTWTDLQAMSRLAACHCPTGCVH